MDILTDMLKYVSFTSSFFIVPIEPNSRAMLNDVKERGTGNPIPNVNP
jgi:methyl coenzyme M reductase gamma subunit